MVHMGRTIGFFNLCWNVFESNSPIVTIVTNVLLSRQESHGVAWLASQWLRGCDVRGTPTATSGRHP